MTHCQNEAEVKFQMDIDHHISPGPTGKAGAMRYVGDMYVNGWSSDSASIFNDLLVRVQLLMCYEFIAWCVP